MIELIEMVEKHNTLITINYVPARAKGLTCYFGINIWSGPWFEPALSKS